MAAPPPNEQSGGGTMTEEKLLADKVAGEVFAGPKGDFVTG
jgi:hypothetical protein